jgi:hypothetical protein
VALMPAVSTALQAPIGGWDTREALADMPVANAIIMDNFFPGSSKVSLRRGSAAHSTGMTGAVDSLLEYTPLSGSGKLFAANSDSIYDVTSSGAVGAAVVGSLANARWQSLQIGTSGGQFLFAVNGADTPITYNGSTWGTSSITGPTSTNLIWCNLHQRRLWFGETASLSAWYLAVNSISGAASEFSLAGVARLGGYIMAMGTWTRDAGDGQDDVAVFLTSEGEAIVYAGTDPASSATWGLIGVFRIGKPIGRRCVMKAGADLIMVTQDGFVATSSILSIDRSQSDKVALSAQIARAVNDAVRDGSTLYGWQPLLYPRGTQMVFNVPISTTEAHQYVFNTLTGAPCRFKGMNARCWALLNDNLYFGGVDGKVRLADSGTSDDGANIEGDALQAFSYFGSPGRSKAFKSVEPIFESAGNPNAALDLNLDFQVKVPTAVAAASPSSAALWGISKWGIGTWGSALQVFKGWRGVRGKGRAAALRVRVNSASSRPAWVATNFRYVPGGLM